MKIKVLLGLLGLGQIFFIVRVISRMLVTARGQRIQPVSPGEAQNPATLTIIVPVLNEVQRLAPCLDGLLAQGQEVSEMLIVDGGSHDGTRELVYSYIQRDKRLRLIEAGPPPAGWNGKCWGLHTGFQMAASACDWILTLDADVRPAPALARSLLGHARATGLRAFSVATQQEIAGMGQGLLHPALLTTLIYRFGIPGRAAHTVNGVQANGQCFLCRYDLLQSLGGFALASDSVCEDVTIARALVASGEPVGFYEAGALVRVAMYRDWRETWQNWPRSLPMRDRFSGWHTLYGWLEILLIQALPFPLFLALIPIRRKYRSLLLLNGCGLLLRAGVLYGTARAYRQRPWSYWLSPLCDLPVALVLGISALRRRHTWRGRVLVRGGLE